MMKSIQAVQIVNIWIGSVILLGLYLAHNHEQIDLSVISWLWLVVFVGVDLVQMGITKTCPMKMLLRWMFDLE